jgi:hypothetical protein
VSRKISFFHNISIKTKIMEIIVEKSFYNFHKFTMTTLRSFLTLVSVSFFTSMAHAAPPADLMGNYVTLRGDRIEFPTASSGVNGSDAVTYTYQVQGALSASLVVTYPASGRSRHVNLNFLEDGTPLSFQEFDLTPPLPPLVRSGALEIGLLEVTPPLESSAPDSLSGTYVTSGGKRFEFLTAGKGRTFSPGKGDYFSYDYTILDEVSAGATIRFDYGTRVTELVLTFDAMGNPSGFQSSEFRDGAPVMERFGIFERGVNRHLGDLKIGNDAFSVYGNDHYNALGLFQTAGRFSDSMKTVVYRFELENDGDTDRFRIDATGARHSFKAEYFSLPGRENLTAEMTTGRYVTYDLGHREVAAYSMELTPLRDNGAFLGGVTARSQKVEGARDTVTSFTLVKVKRKSGDSSGKSRAKGKSRR